MLPDLIKKNKTIIILSHELEKCLAIADTFIILHKGKIVFNGSAEDGLKLDLKKYALHNPISNNNFKELFWQ
jgi:biotin transport system ATP-binding protein